jgi:hypothetical protein
LYIVRDDFVINAKHPLSCYARYAQKTDNEYDGNAEINDMPPKYLSHYQIKRFYEFGRIFMMVKKFLFLLKMMVKVILLVKLFGLVLVVNFYTD